MANEEFLKIIANMDPLEHMAATKRAAEMNPELMKKIEREKRRDFIKSITNTLGGGASHTSNSSSGSNYTPEYNDYRDESVYQNSTQDLPEKFDVVEAANQYMYLGKHIKRKDDDGCR